MNNTHLPMIGTRIHYTGDMANAPGEGYAVRLVPGTAYGREGVDVALDDGRYFRALSVSSFSGGPGCRFRVLEDAPVALPAECERRVRDEELRRRHAQEQREAQEAKRRTDIEAGRAALASMFPNGLPAAAIVAELREDQSDAQTDYFGSRRVALVVLGFSKHNRDLFPELRKAAAGLPATAHLATGGVEHREKYSMGAGYYLAGERGRDATGWSVRKVGLSDDVLAALGCPLPEHLAKITAGPAMKHSPSSPGPASAETPLRDVTFRTVM